MPHDASLLVTLAAAFTAAWLLGVLAQRLRLSPIVGYLLAGIVVGPRTPGFVGDIEPAEPARRGRRHPADVRRRPALPLQGPARREACRGARRAAPERRRHGRSAPGSARPSAGRLAAGITLGMALAVASTVVLLRGLESQNLRDDAGRATSRRLAHRRGHPHRGRARRAPGARGRRRCGRCGARLAAGRRGHSRSPSWRRWWPS